MDRVNEKKLESSKEKNLLSDLEFIKDVIDPQNIYDRIDTRLSEDNLNLMIISAPMGMGKTVTWGVNYGIWGVEFEGNQRNTHGNREIGNLRGELRYLGG